MPPTPTVVTPLPRGVEIVTRVNRNHVIAEAFTLHQGRRVRLGGVLARDAMRAVAFMLEQLSEVDDLPSEIMRKWRQQFQGG